MIHMRAYILIILLTLFLSACSTGSSSVQKRYFFPPAPLEPKLEYLKGYFSDHDLKPDKKDFMTEFVLGETRAQAIFTTPVDVASDGEGRVFVADSGSRQIFVLDLVNHRYRVMAAPRTGGVARAFGVPVGVTISDDGRIFVADVVSKGVDVFANDESYLFTLSDPALLRPTAVAVDLNRKVIYVVDTAGHQLAMFNLQGELLGYLGERGEKQGQFNFPTDVDVDEFGNVFVLDSLNARVQVFDDKGNFLRMFGERGTAEGSFEIPKNLAVGLSGRVYVTDALAHKVVIFSREGDLLLRIGKKSVVKDGISPGGFYLPRGLDVDSAGGIWVVDSLNRMVHRFQFLTPQYLNEHPLN